MPRRYKVKRQIGMDHNSNRKSLNSSERWEAKRDIQHKINEYEANGSDLKEARRDIEVQNAVSCYHAEKAAKKAGDSYKCMCPDVISWTDEEVLSYLGLI